MSGTDKSIQRQKVDEWLPRTGVDGGGSGE